MPTHLSGFKDPIHDSQQTFRALLEAFSRPGLSQETLSMTSPGGLEPSCAVALLTLLDLETSLWIQPGLPEAIPAWLLFHTGCRFTDRPLEADFALVGDFDTMPDLQSFNWGNPEYPEASTSLLLQSSTLSGGDCVSLSGPGIVEEIETDIPLPKKFWQQWQAMTPCYPLGLDVWYFSGNRVVGLPRTAHVSKRLEATS